ncbi:MAG: Hsp20/alpha crystallin family protein [Microbacteriaceae bacterium]
MAVLFDPFRDFDRLAGNLLDSRQGPRLMPIDLYRDGDTYLLSADMPGVDPGSIDIDVDGQLLTVRAERTTGAGDGAKWITKERPSGSYHRQFTLGDGVDGSRISARYDNGVLSIVIPVSERAKPRKVSVAAGTPAEASATIEAGTASA